MGTESFWDPARTLILKVQGGNFMTFLFWKATACGKTSALMHCCGGLNCYSLSGMEAIWHYLSNYKAYIF